MVKKVARGKWLVLVGFAMAAAVVAAQSPKPAAAEASARPQVVTFASPSQLYEVQIMVRAGSADDPAGKEGTANVVAQMLIEGGFGDPKNPVTKEKLADITRPWGEAALPHVRVDKQTTTFSMTVPRDSFVEFIRRVLQPMLQQPLFLSNEVDRIRKEDLVQIRSNLRFEQQEELGLLALDNWIFEGTPLGHLPHGTVQGLRAITPADLVNFYRQHYTPGNIEVAASVTEEQPKKALLDVLPAGKSATPSAVGAPHAVEGRHLLIITQPNAIATGVHFGFPIDVRRGDPDYWPLFVGNVFLGLHRDDFGRLYQEIRSQRGYNYGDYSYVEYYAGRPYFLFPPPTTPRNRQYFSIWIRPVSHQYTHFVTKAATAELDRFIREGLTPEQVAATKVKTRTLYLKYADSKSRQLGYRLDDLFYGTGNRGYLLDMLKNIDKVTTEQVNAAIKKHLQMANMKYIIVTNEVEGAKLADDIANNKNVQSKTLEEYHITEPLTPDQQAMLAQDKQWAAYPLNIPQTNIKVVKAEEMFEK